MSWMNEYKSKLRTAQEAVGIVKDGDIIVPSHAAGEPRDLTHALCMRVDAGELNNVNILCGLNLSDGEYLLPQYEGKIKVVSTFISPTTRQAVSDNKADFAPIQFHLWGRSFRMGKMKVDGFFSQVSPPDEDGYSTFGVSIDVSRDLFDCSKYKIALVNPNMPKVHGDTRVKITDFDYIVEGTSPIFELNPHAASDDIVDKIGKNIADLIEDGDTLQIGVGNIPNAILRCLSDRKDLGIHTEVFSDTLIPLIKSGVINGSRKKIHPGKILATFLMGTKDYYSFLNDNDMIYGAPVSYVNNPSLIAQIDNMVAVNSAMEIDMSGQLVAEAVGTTQFSGVGGQLDFVRGSIEANNGRSIIALQSTDRLGTSSRISAVLAPGTPVTTPRTDVHYIVTEYGVANLFGKTIRERGKALVEIAHPKFREQLEKDMFDFMNLKSKYVIHR